MVRTHRSLYIETILDAILIESIGCLQHCRVQRGRLETQDTEASLGWMDVRVYREQKVTWDHLALMANKGRREIWYVYTVHEQSLLDKLDIQQDPFLDWNSYYRDTLERLGQLEALENQ